MPLSKSFGTVQQGFNTKKNAMTSKLQKINKQILLIGFIIGNILWIKTLFDISNFSSVRPNFHFPVFFIPLFVFGAVVNLSLSAYCLKSMFNTKMELTPGRNIWTNLIWISIPLSVICVSPVCYRGTIFIAPYLTSTIIRIGLLAVPFIAFLFYFMNKKETGIFILLCSGILLLIPNDKCYNPFNYWWIDKIGSSPLTYLPTMFVILFGITGLYGENQKLIVTILFGLCIGALFISFGHRIGFLW